MKFHILYFCLLLALTSCEIVNPSEEVPSYIKIDKIEIDDPSGLNGSISSKITDVWVNIDGNLLGIFELPVTFPVLAVGKHKVLIRAGIKPNGIDAKRKIYPFYNSTEIESDLSQNSVITLSPKVKYRVESKMEWNETFENNGFHFDSISGSDVSLKLESGTENVYEGNYSGAILLPPGKTIFKCKSDISCLIPINNQPIYLEFNYKNNISFQIGVVVNSASQSKLAETIYTVLPSSKWNKIYFELTDIVYINTSFSSFNIFIYASKDDSSGDGKIFLDNVKLFHF